MNWNAPSVWFRKEDKTFVDAKNHIGYFLDKTCKGTGFGIRRKWLCPLHADKEPSMSLYRSKDNASGFEVLKAGCFSGGDNRYGNKNKGMCFDGDFVQLIIALAAKEGVQLNFRAAACFMLEWVKQNCEGKTVDFEQYAKPVGKDLQGNGSDGFGAVTTSELAALALIPSAGSVALPFTGLTYSANPSAYHYVHNVRGIRWDYYETDVAKAIETWQIQYATKETLGACVAIPNDAGGWVYRAIKPVEGKRYRCTSIAPTHFSELFKAGGVFICEGAFDALSFVCCGLRALALNSLVCIDRFLALIDKYGSQIKATPIVCFDNDSAKNKNAGYESAKRLVDELVKRGLARSFKHNAFFIRDTYEIVYDDDTGDEIGIKLKSKNKDANEWYLADRYSFEMNARRQIKYAQRV